MKPTYEQCSQRRENLQLTVQPDRVFGELPEVGQRASQVTDRLLHSATLRGARAGRLPPSRGLKVIAGAGGGGRAVPGDFPRIPGNRSISIFAIRP